MRAYIFINTAAGKAKTSMTRLRSFRSVKAADTCWGSPDIIVVAEVKNERTLNDLVLNKIQPVDGVEHTETHIVVA